MRVDRPARRAPDYCVVTSLTTDFWLMPFAAAFSPVPVLCPGSTHERESSSCLRKRRATLFQAVNAFVSSEPSL